MGTLSVSPFPQGLLAIRAGPHASTHEGTHLDSIAGSPLVGAGHLADGRSGFELRTREPLYPSHSTQCMVQWFMDARCQNDIELKELK